MSFFVTRPDAPVPSSCEMSMPCSRAILRTKGLDFVRRNSSTVCAPPLPRACALDVCADAPCAAGCGAVTACGGVEACGGGACVGCVGGAAGGGGGVDSTAACAAGACACPLSSIHIPGLYSAPDFACSVSALGAAACPSPSPMMATTLLT